MQCTRHAQGSEGEPSPPPPGPIPSLPPPHLYTRVVGEACRAPDMPRAARVRPQGSLSTGGRLGILEVSWKLICTT